MSHKKFQHFINWFGIFIRAKTNMQKKKGKFKQKIKEENLPDAQGEGGPASPPGPPGARGSSSPPRAPKLLGGMPPSQPGATRRRRAPSRPPRAFFSRPGDVSQPPQFISPLLVVFPFLSRPIRRRPRSTPA